MTNKCKETGRNRSNGVSKLSFIAFLNESLTLKEEWIMRKINYRLVYNRKKHLNKQGTALVQVEAYLLRRKVYFSTHVYLRPDQWDSRKKRIKNHPNCEALNNMLDEFMIELERRELELWRQGRTVTLRLIKEEFKENTDTSFLAFVRREINNSQLKESTKQNHRTTLSLIQSFKPTTDFADIDYNFVIEFERHLYDIGCQMNTVAKHMKHLKTFINAAMNNGYMDFDNYAFKRYKIKTKESKHVFLLPDEMRKLEEVSLEGTNFELQHTLDAFLFCCYTGLRYSDFVHIGEKNIVKVDGKMWLIFNTVKTGTEVKLPLSLLFDGKALAMLDKYQGRWKHFFLLKDNSSVNKELIRIGRLAHITKHFSFHSARHTNATLLIYKGANITTVQKLLGHRNIATTQIYGEVMGSTIVRDLKRCKRG